MPDFTFTCECCKKSRTFAGPTVQEAKGDAMRAGWLVDIMHDIRNIHTEPTVRALCDSPKCDYPKAGR